ncbi:MAG: O-antigen/teichoic acid export membrane protein [Planctomycetota bacterium]|jgi:O-antigen/teichoic acid export membrane protein
MTDRNPSDSETSLPRPTPESSPSDQAPDAVDADASYGRRAGRSAGWIMTGYVGTQVIRLASNLVLTRLLFEEAFGLMALMNVVLQGLYLLSDVGLGPSIIHSQRRDSRFTNTAFSISVIRGVILFSLGWIFAAPLAEFYDEPQLRMFLPLIALTTLWSGAESINVFVLNRDLNVAPIQIVALLSQLAGAVAMITWAAIEPTVLALVGGVLVTSTFKLILTHVALPGEQSRFAWDKSAALEIVRYGRWIFLSTMLLFTAEQCDRAILGKLISLETLGVYSIGLMIAALPLAGLAPLSRMVLFPYFSRMRSNAEEFGNLFRTARYPILILGGWAFTGLIAGSSTAVEMLYDDRYHAAGWIAQILSAGFWFQLMSSTNDAAAWGRGKPQFASFASLAKLAAIIVFVPASYAIGMRIDESLAFPGVVVGFACSNIARYLTAAAICRPLGIREWRRESALTLLVVCSGGTVAWLDHVSRDLIPAHYVRATLIFIIITAAWMPLGWPLIKDRLAARRTHRTS